MLKKTKQIAKIYVKTDKPVPLNIKLIMFLCALIVLFIRPIAWYKVSFKLFSFYFYLKYLTATVSEKPSFKRTYLLQRILSLLTRTGIPFDIPYQFNSNNIKIDNGTLCCTAHLPFMNVGIRAMVENSYPIDAVIAANPPTDRKVGIWGMKEKIPALKTDQYVLLRTKSLLSKGATVFIMIDKEENNYSPNSMKIVSLTESKVIFLFSRLNTNGTIYTWLEEPLFPYCKTDKEIQENITQLKNNSNQIFDSYKQTNN